MARLLAPGEAAPAAPAKGKGRAPKAVPGKAKPAKPAKPLKEAKEAKEAKAAKAAAPQKATPPLADPATSARRASPVARRRAVELGVDLATISGSGPGGAITLPDVEASAAAPAPAAGQRRAPAPVAPGERGAAMRSAIAAAMSRSKREIPHYYLSEFVPMGRALDWLGEYNKPRPVAARVLPAALLLKAVALALAKVPELNGHFIDGAFKPAAAAHVGVAISLRQGGLIAPALHDVATSGLDQLMGALADLVRRTRAGSLRSSEMSDPTITVTNLGDAGVAAVIGVIYPPQVALVGFGRIVECPVVADGKLVVMPALTATLAADHRVSDGHRGGLFLAELRELLQQPEALAGGQK